MHCLQDEAIAMHKSRGHQNVLVLHGVGLQDSHPYLVVQHMDKGSLDKALKSDKMFNQANKDAEFIEVVRVAMEVSDGLAHIHDHNVVHRLSIPLF